MYLVRLVSGGICIFFEFFFLLSIQVQFKISICYGYSGSIRILSTGYCVVSIPFMPTIININIHTCLPSVRKISCLIGFILVALS
jgi:hypothetical protein